jgi:hypothetical protein
VDDLNFKLLLVVCLLGFLTLIASMVWALWPLGPVEPAETKAPVKEEQPEEKTEPEAAEPSRELVTVPVSIPEVSSSPQKTALKLKRSQRDGMMGKVIFILDARMELSAEDAALVKKYRLGDRVVYESEARKKHAEATKMHAENTRQQASLLASPKTQALGLGKTLYRVARAGASAAMTALSLRITIDSLSKGVHVECKSLEEMSEAEGAIRAAAENLQGYLSQTRGFDGTEEVIEL